MTQLRRPTLDELHSWAFYDWFDYVPLHEVTPESILEIRKRIEKTDASSLYRELYDEWPRFRELFLKPEGQY